MPQVFKVVLTGGPCGGKTTGQARLSSFFETLGWKVYRSPETATILLSGGVKFPELNNEQTYQFQVNILKVMMAIEKTFDDLARTSDKPCLVICDRGCMDAVAFMTADMWERAKRENNWNEVALRDSRYDLIVHMMSAARGAEAFYTLENNRARMESDLDSARERDEMAARAWLGHPYFEAVDNATGFEEKIRRMIALVCERMGVNVGDRLAPASRKRKFLVRTMPSEEEMRRHVEFIDFEVEHDYLSNSNEKKQSRIRKRGRNGAWNYQHTQRYEANGQLVECKTSLPQRDYKVLLRTQRSAHHYTVYKTRRCFLFGQQYFQLDTFRQPCPARCRGIVLLETYTIAPKGTPLVLPDFLEVIREVTSEREFSMFNLSLIKEPTQLTDTSSVSGSDEFVFSSNGQTHIDNSSSVVNALTAPSHGSKQCGACEKPTSSRVKSYSCGHEDANDLVDAIVPLPESSVTNGKTDEREQVNDDRPEQETFRKLVGNNKHTITTVVEEGNQTPATPQSSSPGNSFLNNPLNCGSRLNGHGNGSSSVVANCNGHAN